MAQTDLRSLARVFEQTDYFIWARTRTADNWYSVNIGAPCPEPLRDWLRARCHAPCVWIITAYNPRATAMDAQSNSQRHAALVHWLEASGHCYVAAENRAQAGDWPPEPGVCVLDMDEDSARALALRFDQAAMVAVPASGPVSLVWIND